jgi:Ca2+-binding EF-hand superfamily protein
MRGGGSARPRSRAEHLQREDTIRSLVAGAQERMHHTANREKMKQLMQSIANEKDEVPIEQVMLTAELASVPITAAQRELFFKTPYANRFTSTWDTTSPRNMYGLECPPRSVKWRQFNEALAHARSQQPEHVNAAIQHYADKEAHAIAEAKRRDEEAAELAKQRAIAANAPPEKMRGISDDQLRMIHKVVKQRLSTQFADIRTAFRTFDKDHSGDISAAECTEALMSLNVGVPRKWIDHLVNVADYDRDGEINYQEFARILTCDDITAIKKEGAEEEGLVVKKTEYYKPGISFKEMREAQARIRDMLAERGGLTKMFRVIDEDKSGWCSRKEVRQLILNLNLESVIRPAIIEEMIDLMDVDKDDHIEFKEMARVVTADDIFNMQELVVHKKEAPKKKLTKRERIKEQKRNMGLA